MTGTKVSLVLLSLLVSGFSVSAKPADDPYRTEAQANYHDAHPKYSFQYVVKDDYYNDFGHSESRDGDRTDGQYYVLLPDGRIQNVKYYVDGYSGYVAEVSYDGEAKPYGDAYKPAPSYKQEKYVPAPPSYRPPPHREVSGGGKYQPTAEKYHDQRKEVYNNELIYPVPIYVDNGHEPSPSYEVARVPAAQHQTLQHLRRDQHHPLPAPKAANKVIDHHHQKHSLSDDSSHQHHQSSPHASKQSHLQHANVEAAAWRPPPPPSAHDDTHSAAAETDINRNRNSHAGNRHSISKISEAAPPPQPQRLIHENNKPVAHQNSRQHISAAVRGGISKPKVEEEEEKRNNRLALKNSAAGGGNNNGGNNAVSDVRNANSIKEYKVPKVKLGAQDWKLPLPLPNFEAAATFGAPSYVDPTRISRK